MGKGYHFSTHSLTHSFIPLINTTKAPRGRREPTISGRRDHADCCQQHGLWHGARSVCLTSPWLACLTLKFTQGHALLALPVGMLPDRVWAQRGSALGPPIVRGSLTLCGKDFTTRVQVIFESTFIKAGDSRIKEAFRVEDATGESLGRAALAL